MNIGTVQRAKPELAVLRGFDPNEPVTGQRSLPVKAGVTIKSGQIISAKFDGTTARTEWVLGKDAGAALCYVALKDSTAFDVVASDLLVGLPCSGKFVLETAFYKAGDTYTNDVYLTADGVTGDFKATTLESGEPIYGVVRVPTEATTNSGVVTVTKNDSSAVAPVTVLRLETMYLPNSADAA
jgi:hypothetical protein